MNSFLLTITACIVMLFGALYIAPNYIEWNEYRDVFEDQASRVIGREVKVEGNVKLKLLPAPYLEFQKVTILDKNRAKGYEARLIERKKLFAKVNSFKLWLAIPPLLQGNIKIKKLELASPHIYLRFDKSGRANWRDLGRTEGIDSVYIPGDVSFDSINITQGKVSIYQSGAESPLTVDSITGVLAAESLKGPYRFAGNFNYQGEERKLVFNTSKQDDLGVLKVQSILDILGTGSRYVTSGDLHGFSSIPSFKGKLVGEVPVTLLSMLKEKKRSTIRIIGEKPEPARRAGGPAIRINSEVSANLKRVELNNLAISVEDDRRPQSLNGNAILDWNKGFNVNARLKATWLDLDQMFGVSTADKADGDDIESLDKDSVGAAFGLFVSALNNMGNTVTRAAINAEVDDARLGGSQLGSFELHLTKNLDRFRIAKLSVQLPGRNHVDLSGDLIPADDKLSFSGPVSIKGISLGALTHWASSKDKKKTVFASNPYFLKGNISYSPERFEITDLRGDLNGAGVSGLFKYDYTARKEFVLELDSDKVDLRDVVGKNTTLKSLVIDSFSENNENGQVALNSNDAKQSSSLIDSLTGLQGRVKLRIGKIHMPNLTGRDILVDGRLSGGLFALKSFKMVADDGMRISGRGQIKNLNKNPEGNVRFSVEADTPQGLQSLARQIDLPDSFVQNERLLSDLSPLRVAITLNMLSGGLPSTDISIAGSAAKSQLTINARHEGSINTLGDKQLDLSGTLINPKSSALISQLIRARGYQSTDEAGQGTFSIQASGIPNNRLNTHARLDAGSTQASFKGDVSFQKGASSGRGKVTVRSSDAAAGLSLIGVENVAGYTGESMSLSAGMIKKADLYEVTDVQGKIGSMSLVGAGEVDLAAKPMRVEFTGSVSETSLPTLFSYLTPSALPSDLQKVAAIAGAKLENGWSNRPFDTSHFQSIQGKLHLKFDKMKLADKVMLQDGMLRASLRNGKLSFSRFRGQLFNGPFSASGSLSSNGGPVALQASISLEDADLAELFKNRENRALARGEASASLKLAGEGLSPLGLVSELKGSGRVSVRNGEIFNFSPDALSKVISNISGKADNKALEQSFWSSLKGQSFPIRNVRASVGVKSGTLNINKVAFSAGSTQAQLSALFELAGMRLDSEWKLQSGKSIQGSLPGVRLVFAGPITKVLNTSPSVDMGQLSQSLAVRQIEKNFDTLKKLEERDPETIRRLRNQAEQKLNGTNQQDSRNQRITNVPVQKFQEKETGSAIPQQGRNLNQAADQERRVDSNGQPLPALTNLGSIEQKNGTTIQGAGNNANQVGIQYSYDKKKIDNSAISTDTNDDRDQIADAVRQKLAEEQDKKKRLKQKEKSFFDSLFSGGDG